MGLFVEVQVSHADLTQETREQLVQVCPVDVFVLDHERLVVRCENEDECTLCELCLKVAPPGTLTIRKMYKDEHLIS